MLGAHVLRVTLVTHLGTLVIALGALLLKAGLLETAVSCMDYSSALLLSINWQLLRADQCRF